MLITYVLLSCIAASVVLGPAVNQQEMELVYEDVDVQRMDEQVTAAVGIKKSDNATNSLDGSRSSNLKYVAILQKSSIWSEIKKKTLTIKSQVDGKIIEKQPETLSDQELEQLKQACHDGLKCVAVDQLLILKTVKQPSNNGGKTAMVFTAISKITKVITEYTTEYHEDTYQYAEVTASDDPSKVYQSATTIVEDNRELCQVGVVSDDSSKNNDAKTNDSKTLVNNPDTSNNDSNRNYGTINNYNVNKDTVNVATINFVPSNDTSNKSVLKPVASNANNSPKNVNQVNGVQVDNNSSGANQDKSNELISNVDSKNSNTGVSNTEINKDAKPYNYQQNSSQSNDNNIKNSNDKTANSNVAATTNIKDSTTNTGTEKNSVSIDNPSGLGKTSANTEIASSGSSNQHTVKKGNVLKGNLNNGNMRIYNQNHGVMTKGKISDSSAKNGTISIGTINEGPINYSTTEDHSNNKKLTEFNNVDLQQYATIINKIYSSMLKEFLTK